jgi:hypothetical protein
MDLTSLIWIVIIGTSIWVYFDAKAIGMKSGEVISGKMQGLDSYGPGSWLVGCLLLWIVFFPLYLMKRGEFKKINNNPINSSQTLASAADPRIKCPHCAEDISAFAKICKHCHRELFTG